MSELKFENYISQLNQSLIALDKDKVLKLGQKIKLLIEKDNCLIIAGNGGSAAIASHAVCDFSKTAMGGATIKRLRVLSLADNVALLSAWSNDKSYEFAFAEMLKNFARPGDLFLAISASGNSPNIVKALDTAKDLGVESFSLIGFDGGKAKNLSDNFLWVDSNHYGIVEDAHMAVIHFITDFLKGSSNEKK